MDIKTKIATEEFAQLSAEEVAAALNAEPYVRYRSLTSRELLLLSAKIGMLSRLIDAKSNLSLPHEVRSCVLAATMVLERDNTELDLNDSDIRELLLPALVAAGVIAEQQAEILVAAAKVETTWSLGMVGRQLDPDDIVNARAD